MCGHDAPDGPGPPRRPQAGPRPVGHGRLDAAHGLNPSPGVPPIADASARLCPPSGTLNSSAYCAGERTRRPARQEGGELAHVRPGADRQGGGGRRAGGPAAPRRPVSPAWLARQSYIPYCRIGPNGARCWRLSFPGLSRAGRLRPKDVRRDDDHCASDQKLHHYVINSFETPQPNAERSDRQAQADQAARPAVACVAEALGTDRNLSLRQAASLSSNNTARRHRFVRDHFTHGAVQCWITADGLRDRDRRQS
jgi:hypothetical protein